MRTRKEYLNRKVSDFPEYFVDEQKFINELLDLELNTCDDCGIIKSTYELVWIGSEEFFDDKVAQKAVDDFKSALCENCLAKRRG